jgi:hypothetical protein
MIIVAEFGLEPWQVDRVFHWITTPEMYKYLKRKAGNV